MARPSARQFRRHQLDEPYRVTDIHERCRVLAPGRDRAINKVLLMYSETTRSIKVTVKPFYLEQHSSPADNHYVWAYHVRIENCGADTVQLRHRHWRITDGFGRLQEVRGPGVVGEEPVLAPGESFEYTSSCPLATPSGFMVGDYEMETKGGENFLVRVPAFSLDTPQPQTRLN